MPSTALPLDLDLVRDQPLFRHLNRSSAEHIAAAGWMLDIPRGHRVLSRGDELSGLYTVFEGRLKLYMLSCSGDERVLRVLVPGDSFGEAIMFNQLPSPVFVEALTAGRLGFYPREVITGVLARNPDFTQTMLRSMSALMRQLILDLETCCLQSALQRIVSYLLREAELGGPPHVEVQLPAAKSVIASTLNISAETFSRELHGLQAEGLIEINRRTIYLRDRGGLSALAMGGARASAGKS